MSTDQKEDYTFRFKLESQNAGPVDNDPMLEMIRLFLNDFLNIGHLTHKGQKVSVDGFCLTEDAETVHTLFLNNTKQTSGPS